MESLDKIESNDLTANELYEKLESWNKDIKDSFIEGKKEKKITISQKIY